MERELKEITLSNGETVKMITSLTWGEKEKINNSMAKGAKIDATGVSGFDMGVVSEAKYIALDICVKEIVSVKGEISKFSKDWINNLSAEDGDLVFDSVDVLANKKKV